MSLDDQRLRLTDCDRATLEMHYIFSKLSEYQQSVLQHKTELLERTPSPVGLEYKLSSLDGEIMRVDELLEDIRVCIEGCLSVRARVERSYY